MAARHCELLLLEVGKRGDVGPRIGEKCIAASRRNEHASRVRSPEITYAGTFAVHFGMMKGFPAFRLLVLILAGLITLDGCYSGKRLTKANVAEVTEGMSKKQVESVLGLPTSIDTTDLLLLKKTTYVYRQANESITIVFKDDKVSSKDSTLSE